MAKRKTHTPAGTHTAGSTHTSHTHVFILTDRRRPLVYWWQGQCRAACKCSPWVCAASHRAICNCNCKRKVKRMKMAMEMVTKKKEKRLLQKGNRKETSSTSKNMKIHKFEVFIGQKGERDREGKREPLLTPMYWPDRVWYYRAPRGAVLLKTSSSRRRSPKVIWQNRFYHVRVPASWPHPARLRLCSKQANYNKIKHNNLIGMWNGMRNEMGDVALPTVWPFLSVNKYLAACNVHTIPCQCQAQLFRRTKMLRLEQCR